MGREGGTKVCINGPGPMTLTYFTARSNLLLRLHRVIA